jgi:RHS repeat-associated protein
LQFDGAVSPLPPGEGQGEGGFTSLSASDLSHRYLWGAAVDQLLAQESPPGTDGTLVVGEGQGEGFDLSTPGDVVFTLGDNQNTVRDLAVCNGGVTSVVNHRVFSAYGQLLSQTNPQTGQAAAVDCLLAYTGRPLDQATGLQQNGDGPGGRWYDAITGRWLSEDHIWDGVNLYRYCGNAPTIGTDPSGLGPVLGVSTTTSITGPGGFFISNTTRYGMVTGADAPFGFPEFYSQNVDSSGESANTPGLRGSCGIYTTSGVPSPGTSITAGATGNVNVGPIGLSVTDSVGGVPVTTFSISAGLAVPGSPPVGGSFQQNTTTTSPVTSILDFFLGPGGAQAASDAVNNVPNPTGSLGPEPYYPLQEAVKRASATQNNGLNGCPSSANNPDEGMWWNQNHQQ